MGDPVKIYCDPCGGSGERCHAVHDRLPVDPCGGDFGCSETACQDCDGKGWVGGPPSKLALRIQSLREMEDGWYDGYDKTAGSKAPTEEAIKTAEALAGGVHLVPLPRGGVQLEVHTLGFDFEVEVGSDGKIQNVWVGRSDG